MFTAQALVRHRFTCSPTVARGDRLSGWENLALRVLRGSQMEDQRLAVHRTIVIVDVEGFGDHHRTDVDQVAVRAVLYCALREAFGRAGISWEDCRHEDRGDGLFVLVPAEVPKGLLVEKVPLALAADLRA